MSDPLPPDNDTAESIPTSDDDQGRFVIDYTVGPPGVGPATTVVRDAHQESSAEHSAVAGSVSHRKITVEDGGEVVAEATVITPDETGEARAGVTMAPGHLPVGARQRVADAVHEAVVADQAGHLTASVPRGEGELVDGIRDRLSDVHVRAAGASSIIEGDVNPR